MRISDWSSDVCSSDLLEPSDADGRAGKYLAVRLGLRMVRGLANDDGAAIVAARGDTPYSSAEEIQRRAGVGRGALDRIGDAAGLASLGNQRREGLWGVKGLGDAALPPFRSEERRGGQESGSKCISRWPTSHY